MYLVSGGGGNDPKSVNITSVNFSTGEKVLEEIFSSSNSQEYAFFCLSVYDKVQAGSTLTLGKSSTTNNRYYVRVYHIK